MRGQGRLFSPFLATATLVVVGLFGLPRLNAIYWTGETIPRPLAAMWLVWMFALWLCLVALMVFVLAWLNEQLDTPEPTVIRIPRNGGPTTILVEAPRSTRASRRPREEQTAAAPSGSRRE